MDLPIHFSLIHEQDPENILKLLRLGQNTVPKPKKGTTPFSGSIKTVDSDLEMLILISAASHSTASHSCLMKPIGLHHLQKAEVFLSKSKMDPLDTFAAPRNSVLKGYEQNLWQMASLGEIQLTLERNLNSNINLK